MASQTQTTTDHDEIRRWDQAHDGKPACVRNTATRDDMAYYASTFPAARTELKHISWDE
jgi:hypothetical protein